MLINKASIFFFLSSSLAAAVQPRKILARQERASTNINRREVSTKCGDIIRAVDAPQGSTSIFESRQVYECLSSVPFHPAVANRFLEYWNQTIQFQSTLAYLKNPPEGYQQPAVDVNEELLKIRERANSGYYKNQYAFEAELQLLIYSLHDGHVNLNGGALAAFSFGAPFEIASVSVDGKQSPEIYFTADIIDSQIEGWVPSPIDTINGENAVEFLTKFAALNSWGYVESHADWNALMSSPALDIQLGETVFSGQATFYPGDDLIVHFKNFTEGDETTTWETTWMASYNELANYTGPLATGGDFYNYFVLGYIPDSFDGSVFLEEEDINFEPEPAPGNWLIASFGAFPEQPDIAQTNLGPLDSGLVSAYFYQDISTAVLSLPSFQPWLNSVENYTLAVYDFITSASDAGMENVIIDLQRNSGGLTLLAYTIFKAFFPDLMPYRGSRRRMTPWSHALGSSMTEFWESLNETDAEEWAAKQDMAADEWLVTNRINAATGQNFTSWAEFAGPVGDNGDSFSMVEQYDMANIIFDRAAFEADPTMYIDEQSEWPIQERTWAPEKIAILTDGLCGSSCAMFVEMMTRAGVKTIVAGGRPESGPMQAASGTRGAHLTSAAQLDIDFNYARSIDEFVEFDVNATVPERDDTGIFVNYAHINPRDQMRKDDPTPLQFKYEAADCRVYYTLSNLYNFTRLWYDVAAAAADSSLCVEGSTGFSTTNDASPAPPPAAQVERPTLDEDKLLAEQAEIDDGGFLSISGPPKAASNVPLTCTAAGENAFCADGRSVCKRVPLNCAQGVSAGFVCMRKTYQSNCFGQFDVTRVTEVKARRKTGRAAPVAEGYCYPARNTAFNGCLVSTVLKR